MLATGEKVLPHILESILTDIGKVQTAIAFGEGRFELGVIVQPATALSTHGHQAYIDSIWSTILAANDLMDDHAKISSKRMVIVVPDGRSIPRSDKGSLMRREAYRLFEAQIDEAYRRLDDEIEESPLSLDVNELESSLKTLVQNCLDNKIPAELWDVDDDLFELGMNSLQATRFRRLLLSAIARSSTASSTAERIGRDFVYHHPSVSAMSKGLRGGDRSEGGRLEQREQLMEDLVLQYSSDATWSLARGAGHVILLTGGTGSLGTHLLAYLASLPNVSRIYCLNRRYSPGAHHGPNSKTYSDPYQRQLQALEAKGVTLPEKAWSKIIILQSDMKAAFLGLKKTDYAQLCSEITHILHNAWPMDFKRTLLSLKPQLQILQNLVGLARAAYRVRLCLRPRLLFMSSIAVVGRHQSLTGNSVVREMPIDDLRTVTEMGYAEAKWVCEKMVERAALSHGDELEAAIVRIGQVSGSASSGFWSKDEHFPALLKSSQKIAQLPLVNGVGHFSCPCRVYLSRHTEVLLSSSHRLFLGSLPIEQLGCYLRFCSMPAISTWSTTSKIQSDNHGKTSARSWLTN